MSKVDVECRKFYWQADEVAPVKKIAKKMAEFAKLYEEPEIYFVEGDGVYCAVILSAPWSQGAAETLAYEQS